MSDQPRGAPGPFGQADPAARVGVPGVFDVMRGVGGNIADAVELKSTVRASSIGKRAVTRPSDTKTYTEHDSETECSL